jgi:hypothetical protein
MLYEKTQCDSGLYIGKKLKLDHLKLNSYSRMNVRLAAQVNVNVDTVRNPTLCFYDAGSQ